MIDINASNALIMNYKNGQSTSNQAIKFEEIKTGMPNINYIIQLYYAYKTIVLFMH